MNHRCKTQCCYHNDSHQRGATLAVSLILLFAITMIVIYSSTSTVSELRLSQHEIHTIKALQAADAGLELMMANLLNKTQRELLLVDTDSDAQPDGEITGAIGSSDQTYHVTLTSPTPGDFKQIEVQSIGCSDACSGTCSTACSFHKVIRQNITITSAINSPPAAPLVARGSVNIPSSPDVINNIAPEVIICGGAYSDNPATTIISAGVDVSALSPALPFIDENNVALAATTAGDFFETYFSSDKSTVKSLTGILDCTSGCDKTAINAALSTQQLVWTNGDVTLIGGTYGTATDPIILIVDGNLELRGGATINGLVYVTDPTWDANGAGNAHINGAAIAENSFDTNGNIVIDYDPGILANLNKIILSTAKVSGSWIDF